MSVNSEPDQYGQYFGGMSLISVNESSRSMHSPVDPRTQQYSNNYGQLGKQYSLKICNPCIIYKWL